ILTSKLMEAIQKAIERFPQFLGVSERINLDITQPIDFSKDWESTLAERCKQEGSSGGPTCIDIFVFKKGMYPEVPDFAIGQLGCDHWLIKAVSVASLAIVDMRRVALLIHQNQDYHHVPGGMEWVWKGEEAETNLKLYGGGRMSYTLSNVSHELQPDGGIRRVLFCKKWIAAKNFLWEMAGHRTHGVRSKLGLSRTPARNA